jgi:glutamine amidotransferase
VIAIIDYKAGNLASVKKAFDHLGAESVVTDDASIVQRADKLVLPGVGHFASTRALAGSGLRSAIEERIAAGKPFLGICVGMQWMMNGSSEAPHVTGLSAFDASCERFACELKIPHVGWNRIEKTQDSSLLEGVESGAFVYYAHSYRAPVTPQTVAISDYDENYSAVVESGNLFGVQFHPEKSGAAGLCILRNFAGL